MRKTKTSLPNKKKNNGWRPTARKVTTMTINYDLRSLELSATEWNEAMTFGTPAYNALQTAKRDNPGFQVVKAKAKKSCADFAKLTAKSIQRYVEANGTAEQVEAYRTLTMRTIDGLGFIHEPAKFMEVKSWFLKEFPQVKDELVAHREKIQAILDEAEAKAEKREAEKLLAQQTANALSLVA